MGGLVVLAVLSGCGGDARAPRQEVVLFAAASTGDVMDDIRSRFRNQYGIRVRANYAATSALVLQITNQAEADVFLSANTLWADYLDDRRMLAARQDLLSNELVVVVAVGSGIHVDRPEDLLSDSIHHIAIADPAGVPAGIYARQALEHLGLWRRLEAKLAPGADVRRALAFVETGAAEAGLVYATDAAGSSAVRVALRLDAGLTDPIRYPAALLKRSEGKQAAQLFYRYLTSPEAAKVYRGHGFGILFEPGDGRG